MDQANIIASIVKECLQGPDFSKLKKEILTHEFVSVYWEVIKGIRIEKRKNYTNTKKILFVTDRSVIVQDVELSCGSSRFVTYQIYLKDWEKVFASWISSSGMKSAMRECWERGIYMYQNL